MVGRLAVQQGARFFSPAVLLGWRVGQGVVRDRHSGPARTHPGQGIPRPNASAARVAGRHEAENLRRHRGPAAAPAVLTRMERRTEQSARGGSWWQEVTRYEWLVLAIASAGWVFDVFEGQIFNLTRGQMLQDILGAAATPEAVSRWGEIFLGVFLAGGTVGGIFFGWLGDRWGRRPTMVATILMYSVFSCLTYFAVNLWQVGALRFLVAMGVGGEWAVAAAL